MFTQLQKCTQDAYLEKFAKSGALPELRDKFFTCFYFIGCGVSEMANIANHMWYKYIEIFNNQP